MNRNMSKHKSFILIVVAGTVIPYAITQGASTDDANLEIVQICALRSACLLPNNEVELIEKVADIADKLIAESQKTVDRLLDSLDKTPLSYFSNHIQSIIKQIADVSNMLKERVKKLPKDIPNEYPKAITISTDLLEIVTKYLKQLHKILSSSKINKKAIKLAKELEKSLGALEKSYAKCLKKMDTLIQCLNTLKLTEQVAKLETLKGLIQEAYDELTDPTAASFAQNAQIVDALYVKIEAEKKKK